MYRKLLELATNKMFFTLSQSCESVKKTDAQKDLRSFAM